MQKKRKKPAAIMATLIPVKRPATAPWFEKNFSVLVLSGANVGFAMTEVLVKVTTEPFGSVLHELYQTLPLWRS